MKQASCLNCGHSVSSNFCPKCGQRTSVHRYSFRHFIEHDLIHGFWHVDHGIFFTIKELFTRPGHAVREYIQGKRVRYFNFATLLLVILTLTHFLGGFAQVQLPDLMPEEGKSVTDEIQRFSTENPKTLLLLTIPLYSVFSFLWFKKANLNLTEHFVLNSYKTVGESLIALFFVLITLFYSNIQVLTIIYSIISVGVMVYSFWFYHQFFSVYGYSSRSLIVRSLAVVFSYTLLSMLVGLILGILAHAS